MRAKTVRRGLGWTVARVLIATSPAEGHVTPVSWVARELVARGHEVRWYTGKAYRRKVGSTGAVHEPMRRAFDFSGQNRGEAFPSHAGLTGIASFKVGVKEIFYDAAPDQAEDLLDILVDFPADVLVGDDMCYGACFAHELSGIPLAWIGNSVYILGSRDTAPLGLALPPSSAPLGRLRNRLLRAVNDHLVMRDVRRYADRTRTRVGLPRLTSAAMENIAEPPDLYLVGTTPSFEYPRTDLLPQTHFVGPFSGPSPEEFDPPVWWEDMLARGPVVLVTQGTTANDVERLLAPAIRALADQDLFVVVTTGGATAQEVWSGPLPPNVRVEPFIPYAHLLPHVDVMISNGGFNGVHMALGHGIPLVVTPATEEKGEVAARVSRVGAGLTITRSAINEASIRGAVDEVLNDPRYRRRARELQAEQSEYDGPGRAAELIETLAAQGRRAVRTA
nr:StaG-like glycosyltransferase [uncultured bacterium]